MEVISIIAMSPFLTRSAALGRPSWILSTRSELIPAAFRCACVPPVANMP